LNLAAIKMDVKGALLVIFRMDLAAIIIATTIVVKADEF